MPKPVVVGAVRTAIATSFKVAGLAASDVTLWEINQAFASVPIAACREYDLDEDRSGGRGCNRCRRR